MLSNIMPIVGHPLQNLSIEDVRRAIYDKCPDTLRLLSKSLKLLCILQHTPKYSSLVLDYLFQNLTQDKEFCKDIVLAYACYLRDEEDLDVTFEYMSPSRLEDIYFNIFKRKGPDEPFFTQKQLEFFKIPLDISSINIILSFDMNNTVNVLDGLAHVYRNDPYFGKADPKLNYLYGGDFRGPFVKPTMFSAGLWKPGTEFYMQNTILNYLSMSRDRVYTKLIMSKGPGKDFTDKLVTLIAYQELCQSLSVKLPITQEDLLC